MQKNVAGQKWIVFAFDETDNTAKTGDAANITGNLRLDGGAANAIDDANPTELEDGYYVFDITQAECNADMILIAPASGTANIQVIGVPGAVWTTPENFPALGIESDGDAHADLKQWLGVAPLALSAQRVQVLVGAITNGIIVAATFAANALDAVWSTAARILTAPTNLTDDDAVVDNTQLSTIAGDVANLDGDAMRGTDSAATAANLTTHDTAVKALLPGALVGGRIDADIGAKTGNVNLSTNEKSDVNAEVDTALDTAIPGAPTADSINERVAAIDDLSEASGAGDLAAILAATGTTLPAAITALVETRPQKNVAFELKFHMKLSSDHVTAATGKTVAVQVSKDGGAFAGATNTPATEMANGWYKITLAQAEMNADEIAVRCTNADCDTTDLLIVTSS